VLEILQRFKWQLRWGFIGRSDTCFIVKIRDNKVKEGGGTT
jgi:hypothetical protein